MNDDEFIQRSCVDKKRYRTWAVAVDAASELKLMYGHDLTVYQCDICGGHHLTKAEVETTSGCSLEARGKRIALARGKVRRPQKVAAPSDADQEKKT
jgi:hypothetical protein